MSTSSLGKSLKIGEVARRSGVAVATIRYYESLGLVDPVQKANNGYRYYDEQAIQRLLFIKHAQSLQFSLTDIQQLLRIRTQGDPMCSVVKDLLDRKIVDLERNIQQALSLKSKLENYRSQWITQPEDDPQQNVICSLIEGIHSN